MREQLEARLAELEHEYEVGDGRLRDVELQQARLRETLLRIAGAIQVLRELLDAPGANSHTNSSQLPSLEVGASLETNSTPAVNTAT